MPKRKRSEEESSSHKLTKILSTSHQAIHHALKIAKGHERQRQSKRLRDPQTDAAKRARLQNEVIVLKSLDLNQIALTHLRAALLRIKSIAECDKLPEEVKAPVPKADLTEDEEKALHNVTSCLFARPEVKKETEKAIDVVGKALGVEVPEKKKGRVREKDLEKLLEKEKKKSKDGEDTTTKEKNAEQDETTTKPPAKEKVEKGADGKKRNLDIVTTMDTNGAEEDSESDVDEMAEKEEQELAKLDALLGSSDDEPELDEETIAAAKARNKAAKQSAVDELDPMEITSGEEDEAEEDYDMEDYDLGSDGDSEDNDISGDEEDGGASEDAGGESGSESGSFQGFSDHEEEQISASELSASESDEAEESESESESSAISSPPRKKKVTSTAPAGTTGASTFLPTLMGGYISDSNSSASDIDIAPNSRKNRRGQRARQAIWEKKYKEQAKHLHKANNKRDAGWDLKRGAVDPASAGKPWKMGIKNPLLEKDKQKEGAVDGQGENNDNGGRTLLNNPRENARGGFGKGRGGKADADRPLNRKERRAMGIKTPVGPPGGGGFGGGGGGGGGKPPAGMPPKKRDDEGPLHPSWEARKKAKAALETAPFQGKKITFD